MKLFWKLFCSLVSTTILACSIGGFVLIDGQFRAALEQEVRSLYDENDILRYVLSQAAEGQALSGREELSQLTWSTAPTVAFRLSDKSGAALGGSGSLPAESLPLTSALAENQRGWRLNRAGEGTFILHGASALTLPDGTVYLENCRDVSALFAQRSAQYRSFFYMMLALTAGVGTLSLAVSHLILRPLGQVSDAARKMADGELGQRVSVAGGDEVAQLAADFNAMARRLEAQMEELAVAARRQKDFTGSFAHEIKTPLTSIIGYADLLLSRDSGPERVRESAGYIFQEGRRLEALSGKLMELIVLDRQDFPLRPVAMRAFLEDAGNALRPAFEQAGLQLDIDAEEAPIFLEPDLMKTVCLNLLDNARKATPSGGAVTLTGRTEETGYLIEVTDTGRGIPAEELVNVGLDRLIQGEVLPFGVFPNGTINPPFWPELTSWSYVLLWDPDKGVAKQEPYAIWELSAELDWGSDSGSVWMTLDDETGLPLYVSFYDPNIDLWLAKDPNALPAVAENFLALLGLEGEQAALSTLDNGMGQCAYRVKGAEFFYKFDYTGDILAISPQPIEWLGNLIDAYNDG